MWEFAASELNAVWIGTDKARDWWKELALFTAWHTAMFANLAFIGKLEPWAYYRQKVTGTTTPVKKESWQERKAARKAQMGQFKRHQQQRKVIPKVRRG